jgi:hypothetical protein
MNQELNRFFNRIQNRNFSFATDKFDEEYLIKLEKKLQKEINKNLLKNPDTTCNWLKSIYNQILEGQEYIHKTYVLNIDERIISEKIHAVISNKENENFEGALVMLNALDLFKNLIIQNIKLVKPEIIKSKKSIGKIQQFKLTVPQIALLHVYKNNPITKPSTTDRTAQNIAELHKQTSGDNLYNTYNKLQGYQAQRLNQKSPLNMIKDIEAIYTLLNENETKKADGDLIYLDNKLKEIREKE